MLWSPEFKSFSIPTGLAMRPSGSYTKQKRRRHLGWFLYLTPAQYSLFMTELFNEWLQHGDPQMSVLTFDEFFRFILGHEPMVCYNQGSCSAIVAVESNGDVVSCTRPFDRAKFTCGNLYSDSLETVIEGPKMINFRSEDLISQQNASHCLWFGLCYNGCPQHCQTAASREITGAGYYCGCQSLERDGTFAMWSHLHDRCTALLNCDGF